ncbi:MAG TPA: DUF5336 domain-containing protein [Mycobacterium sp.]|nr:DUF5336 domain-containing protein [Mycobacterium sp.]
MTYSPGSPGGPGYQPGSYGAPTPSYTSAPAAEPGPSKLPAYLNIAVVLLGVAAYVAAFGPVYASSTNFGPFTVEATSTGGILLTLAAVLAALLAAVGLLPKTKNYPTIVAMLAVVGVLAVLEQVVNKPQVMSPSGPVSATVGWALWLVLALTILQAIAAVLVLLYHTGVLTPPAPKPRYDAHYGSQYGQYRGPGGYYNQPPAGQPGPRQPYPSQYGGSYTPGPQGAGADSGPPTPPTGYPSFNPPPAVGSSGLHHATNPNLGPLSSPASPSSSPSSPSSSSEPGSSSDSTGSTGSSGPSASS